MDSGGRELQLGTVWLGMLNLIDMGDVKSNAKR